MNISFHITVVALAMIACQPASAAEKIQPCIFCPGQMSVIRAMNDSVPERISVEKLRTVTVQELLDLNETQTPYSYTLTTVLRNGDIVTVPNRGNRFHPKSLDAMQQAAPGIIITIENILVIENARQKKLPSLIYRVVE